MQLLMEPQWFIPLFMLFCYGGIELASSLAGWSSLASTMRAQGVPEQGERFRFVTVSLGSRTFPMRYRRCARLVFNEQGFYVGLMAPFRLGSPALFVPWGRVESCEEEQSIGTRVVTFCFRGHWPVLKLRGPIGQVARSAYLASLGRATP
jgi:hypothetical protein